MTTVTEVTLMIVDVVWQDCKKMAVLATFITVGPHTAGDCCNDPVNSFDCVVVFDFNDNDHLWWWRSNV